MQPYEHGLRLRSASSTSFPRHQLEAGGGADSIAITRELLHGPRVPERGSSARSSSGFTPSRQSRIESSAATTALQSRRAFRSSNTWTSSSAGLFSDQDDIEDRTYFLQEYNRLAGKVCRVSEEQHGVLTASSMGSAVSSSTKMRKLR